MSYLNTHPTLKSFKTSQSKTDWYKSAVSGYLPDNKNAKILEIGPGLGEGLLYLVMQEGYKNVHAIDIDNGVIDRCKEVIGENAIKVSDINDFLKGKISEYDCVIMYHVIEHIEQNRIVNTFYAIKKSLAFNGSLIIVTPNVASPIIGIDQYLIDFTHKTPFSPHSLEQSMRLGGFSNIEIKNLWPPQTNLSRFIQKQLQIIALSIVRTYLNLFSGIKRKVLTHQILAVAKSD